MRCDCGACADKEEANRPTGLTNDELSDLCSGMCQLADRLIDLSRSLDAVCEGEVDRDSYHRSIERARDTAKSICDTSGITKRYGQLDWPKDRG